MAMAGGILKLGSIGHSIVVSLPSCASASAFSASPFAAASPSCCANSLNVQMPGSRFGPISRVRGSCLAGSYGDGAVSRSVCGGSTLQRWLAQHQSSCGDCHLSSTARLRLRRLGRLRVYVSCSTLRLGEGMRQLRLEISRSSPCRKIGRKALVTCQVGGAAVPGDAGNGLNDYLPNFTDKSLPLRIRAICFYLWTYAVAVPLFFVMLAFQPFVLVFDKYRRKAQHMVNRVWASLSILLFYKTEIIGLENLPSANEPAVYVANHQSFLDIYTLFLLGRPFKFISKTSNFLIPIIGWSMYLTGHVPLRRLDKRSQLECLKKCIELVKAGVPVLFFPEGTRTSDGKMAAFKKGAFNVATKGNVPVVPIALVGTGKLMPNGLESTLRPGKVKIIIHPQIRGGSADELCNKSRGIIAQTLLTYGMPVA